MATIARAQDEESNFDSSYDYTFGKELRFLLSSENALDVERITLYFHPELSAEMYVVNVPFQAGETVSVTHPIDVAMIKLRPFSRVTYSWQLETDRGSRNVAEQSFTYEDDRFDWQQMTRTAATVHWTGSGPSFGDDVLSVIDQALSPLSTMLPLQSLSPFDVYVYPSSAELREAVELAGLDNEKTSYPDLGVIFVTAVNPQSVVADLGQSIPYELAQLMIYRVTSESYEDFPWWLAEGMGTIIQTRPNPRSAQILDEAVESEDTIPLRHLCEPPDKKGDRAVLATVQSSSVVEYIRNRFGDQMLADLVQSYAQGSDCQAGVRSTLGITLDQLDSAWLDARRIPSPLAEQFSEFGLWILILLAGSGLALLLVRHSTQG